MKPNEKAEALVSKYLGTIIFNINQNIEADCVEAAKKSALICVDEILQSIPLENNTQAQKMNRFYWIEVTQAIRML